MSNIRSATTRDREGILEVCFSAFSEDEREDVATLTVNLLSEAARADVFGLVADIDGTVAGYIAFSPVTVKNNDTWKGYILAPLGVDPALQKQGIGSRLIEKGKQRLSDRGVNMLFVYGDPKYYGQFGFEAESASRYVPPYKLEYPFGWQALALNETDVPETTLELSFVESLRDPELW